MERNATRWEVADGVGVLTLARPERLNAWTGLMDLEVRTTMAAADEDPAVRVVVLTGAGRGFCAGADTRALAREAASGSYNPGIGDDPPLPGAGVAEDFTHEMTWLMALRKPVIAAINGAAAGAGFVLACCCDLRFAAAGAKLTTSHGRLGLPAEFGLSWILPRLIGLTRAADLLLSSRVVLAEEAAEMGLVNAVLPADELMDHVLDYARRLATEISPASLAATKRQLWLDQLRSLDESATDARTRLEAAMATADFREGVAALREKRAPRF